MRKNIAKSTLLTIVIIIASIAVLTPSIQQVQAAPSARQPTTGQLPSGARVNATVPTSAHLSFRPTTIGLNQIFLVNFWVSPGLHVERILSDYTVTITKPDGTKDVIVMDSFPADGTAWFEYVADQLGEWKLKFDFLGTYFPEGVYYEGIVYDTLADLGTVDPTGQQFRGATYIEAAYYMPSSTPEQTLTVTNDIVYSWPEFPMPTDYWTRPLVANENREWWPMAGNYPGTGYFNSQLPIWNELYPGTNPSEGPRYGFHPWVQGPNSAHIVWKRQDDIAGFTGPDLTLQSVGSVSQPSLVFAGRAYGTQSVIWYNGSRLNCAVCYDLRTGEMYYMIPTAAPFNGITPSIISYNILAPNWISPTSPVGGGAGSAPGETKIQDPELLSISGGYLLKIDPWTGALSGNYSIAPLTGSGGTYYKNGFVYGIQNLGSNVPAAQRYRLINWTVFGNSNFTTRIISNTSYASSALPTLIDWNVRMGASVTGLQRAGAYVGTTVQGFNAMTGASVWNTTVDETLYSGSAAVADHGKVAFQSQQGYFVAFDLQSGQVAWRGEKQDYPWDSSGFGAYAIQSAYGMLFRDAYSGVYAIDWDTGDIVWKYEATALSPYESPYTGSDNNTVYSFNSGGKIADGKMYVSNAEHSATYPLTRGWSIHCINITTGELIWKIAHPMSSGVIADGYMTASDSYTGYMYVFGKGISTTTVSAPDTSVQLGTPFMIKGTVLDQSPAQPGTPCVSKESMSLQMQYLHLMSPIGGLWGNETITGVSVSLDTVDPNGNSIHIGEVISDGYSGTFGYTWQPDIAGQYTITATFMGDESYGSSLATTYVSVVEAPVETVAPTQQPISMPPYEMYTVGTGIAIIVVVVLIGLLLLRKRP
jgi:hypothetical protein